MTRFLAIAAVAGALSLPGAAAAQTTTTTSSTTTTTLADGCAPDDTTLDGLDCRIDAIHDDVAAASGLGRFRESLLRRLQKGSGNLHEAIELCRDGDAKKARKQVQRAGRQASGTLHTIRSNNGRKTITPAVAEALAADLEPLIADLKAVRRSLDCPE